MKAPTLKDERTTSPKPICPHCCSTRLHPSKRGNAGILRRLAQPLVVSVRCHTCCHLFHLPGRLLGGPSIERCPAHDPHPRESALPSAERSEGELLTKPT